MMKQLDTVINAISLFKVSLPEGVAKTVMADTEFAQRFFVKLKTKIITNDGMIPLEKEGIPMPHMHNPQGMEVGPTEKTTPSN